MAADGTFRQEARRRYAMIPLRVTCPICRSGHATELYRLEPARWIPGRIVRCEGCGTIYRQLAGGAPPPAAYYDASYAALDYWDDTPATRRALERILAFVSRQARANATLLDVGCGAGAFLTLAAAAGFRASGLELNPALAERARRRSGVEVTVGNIEAPALDGRQVDVVTLLDVVEHLVDPLAALRRCRELLAPGGLLVVYTPNHAGVTVRTAQLLHRLSAGRIDGPVRAIFDCLHTVFFDPRSLSRALVAAGFRLREMRLLPYDASRSHAASGLSAAALRALEAAGPLAGGRFRMLVSAEVAVAASAVQ